MLEELDWGRPLRLQVQEGSEVTPGTANCRARRGQGRGRGGSPPGKGLRSVSSQEEGKADSRSNGLIRRQLNSGRLE